MPAHQYLVLSASRGYDEFATKMTTMTKINTTMTKYDNYDEVETESVCIACNIIGLSMSVLTSILQSAHMPSLTIGTHNLKTDSHTHQQSQNTADEQYCDC